MERLALASVVGVGVVYGSAVPPVQVFGHLSLEFYEGEITSVLGPTGCGKSTLLGLLNGLVVPSTGVVNFGRPRVTMRIGTKPQRDLLLPWRTVRGNARLAREIIGGSDSSEERVSETLEALGLLEYGDMYPDQLSGGMRQKLALGRTLLLDPDLALLDEPFSNIDFHQRLDLERYLFDWIHCRRRTGVVVTHDVEQAVALSDRVVVLTAKPARIALDMRIESPSRDAEFGVRRRDRLFSEDAERVRMALRQES